MYFVYVIQSFKDGNFYTGYTVDLEERLKRHNKGLVVATRYRRPFRIVYYEASLNRKDAAKRERYLKSAWGKRYIKNRIAECLRKVPER